MTVLEAVDCVVVDIGAPVGDPWVIGERGTRQQKKMAEKKLAEKNKLFYTSFFLQRQINQQSINNKSDKMDFADVNDA